MSAATESAAAYGYGIAVLAHVGLAAYLLLSGRPIAARRSVSWSFLAALLATGTWAGVMLFGYVQPDLEQPGLTHALDLLRYALWFAFMLALFRRESGGTARRGPKVLRTLAIISLGLAAVMALTNLNSSGGGASARLQTVVALSLPVCGMLMLEQIFRNLGEDSRWNAKPVCMALACVFLFDVYLFSESLLFGRFDADALNLRGLAHSLAIPFLIIASRRGPDWMGRLQVSRAAAFYSATLILAGTYLLFMAGIGYYVRYFGGEWGRALQYSLLLTGLAFLGALVFSGALRAWLRVFVGKHFYSYRYDYREEWLNFTATMSANRSPQEMGDLIIRGLAKMVECPAGGLWTRESAGLPFAQSARWNMPVVTETEQDNSALCNFLQQQGWVIDLDEFRSAPRRYNGLALPTWLLGAPNAWLVVPLLVGE